MAVQCEDDARRKGIRRRVGQEDTDGVVEENPTLDVSDVEDDRRGATEANEAAHEEGEEEEEEDKALIE